MNKEAQRARQASGLGRGAAPGGDERERRIRRVATLGVILSSASLITAPSAVLVAYFAPVFDAMTSGAALSPPADLVSGPSVWSVICILVTLPGVLVSLGALMAGQGHRIVRERALVGTAIGALAFVLATGIAVYLYSGE